MSDTKHTVRTTTKKKRLLEIYVVLAGVDFY